MLPHDYAFPDPSLAAPYDAPFEVTGGTSLFVRLPALRRGTIDKLLVVQLSGALEGFSYTLYNSAAPFNADGTQRLGADGATPLVADERLYRITPKMAVAAGKDAFASTEGFPEDGIRNLQLGYANQDYAAATPLGGRSTTSDKAVWLKIDAAGAGAKTFGVALTILDPMLS